MPKKAVRTTGIRKAVTARAKRCTEAEVLRREGETLMSTHREDREVGGVRAYLRGQTKVTRAEIMEYEADQVVCEAVIKDLSSILGHEAAKATIRFKSLTDVQVTYIHSEQVHLNLHSGRIPKTRR